MYHCRNICVRNASLCIFLFSFFKINPCVISLDLQNSEMNTTLCGWGASSYLWDFALGVCALQSPSKQLNQILLRQYLIFVLWWATIVLVCMTSTLLILSGPAHLLHQHSNSNISENSQSLFFLLPGLWKTNLAWMELCHPAAWAKLSIVLLVSHWTTLSATGCFIHKCLQIHLKLWWKRMMPYPSESER